MSHPLVIVKNGFISLSWDVKDYEVGSTVGVTADKDPGDGVVCFPPTVDGHMTFDKETGVGTGSYLMRMRNEGEFNFTITIKPKSGGDDVVQTKHVSCQVDPKILHFKSLVADKTEAEVGEDITLSWEIENYSGEQTVLRTIYPDNPLNRDAPTGADGKGTFVDTPTAEVKPGDTTYQMFDIDTEAPDIQYWLQLSPKVTVKLTRATDWQAMLPTRAATKSGAVYAKLNRDNPGPPTIDYLADSLMTETPPADPAATDDEKKKALQKVIDARARIPPRPFHIDFTQGKGNLYMPSGQFRAKTSKLEGIDETPEFKSFTAVSDKILPSKCDKTKPDFDADQAKIWEYFKRVMPAEGMPTTITAAAVDAFVTIGAGFASSGHLAQKLFKNLLAMSATKLSERATAAGLRADVIGGKNEFIVVDTTKGCILKGADAANYICTNVQLLSFIANCGIGAQGDIRKGTGPIVESDPKIQEAQIRGMLDAQFAAFGDSAGPTADIIGWPQPPEERFVLIAHARHGGDFAGWKGGLGDNDAPGADTATVAHNVWARLKKKLGANTATTGPITVVKKARAICDAFPTAKAVIKAHADAEIDGYDYKTNTGQKGADWKKDQGP
ncbi:MAG: hypothetical protein JST92_10935 [Deltaproteobacteria bacterium]|nr:hypothetical protein [Deltaproteobacteria bacterium]